MVAKHDYDMFADVRHTPPSEASDSDGVRLALETARAMEAQGELRDAARWIRRAADEAEKDGNDERVLALASAAADLVNCSMPCCPPPASPSTIPAPVSYVSLFSSAADKFITEVSWGGDAIRVALEPSMRDAKSFSVVRLATGEALPPGSIEAMLVLTGEVEGRVEIETYVRLPTG
jgi:hypothetical protein